MTDRPPPERPIAVLLAAKAESDRRNYRAKHELLRRLLRERPDEFAVDSEEGGVVGLTHRSGFRIHAPAGVIPDRGRLRRLRPVVPPRRPYDPAGVFAKAAVLAVAAAEPARRLWRAHLSCRPVGCSLWYDPEADAAHVSLAKEAGDAHALERERVFSRLGFASLTGSPEGVPPDGADDRPWVPVKTAADPGGLTPRLPSLGPDEVVDRIPGPDRLAALLAGGLLGAGLGYAGGSALDAFDYRFRPRRYRGDHAYRVALLGALLGAAPAALRVPTKDDDPAWPAGRPARPLDADALKEACLVVREELGLDKEAFWQPDGPPPLCVNADRLPAVHVDSFGRAVWRDPNTPEPIRMATVGLLGTASAAAGNAPFVNPYDVANVSLNRRQGFVVGQTLAALGDVSPATRDRLQSSGVWGELLTRVVPAAFPTVYGLPTGWL